MAEESTGHEQKPEEIGQEGQGTELKYLDFVRLAAMQAVVCFSRLYDFAKESSGPLKPGVQAVEGAVKAVVAPVYDRVHGVPYELLKFVDRKVDESVSEVERHVPPAVKEASGQAYTAARCVAVEVQRAGVVATVAGLAKTAAARVEPAAKGVYVRFEPAAERCAVAAWRALNRLPMFPQVAQIAVPTAAHWLERYNAAVCCAAQKGYTPASYLPLVPTKRIAKVFAGDGGAGGAPDAAAAAQ